MEYHARLTQWLKDMTKKELPRAFEDFKIRPELYYETPGNGVCTCGKSHLTKVYVIEFIPEGTVHNIGSSCIERFAKMCENTEICQYILAEQNLRDMLNFVATNETNLRNAKTKGKCLVCSRPTVGKDSQKAKTNYYHFCSNCISPKKSRRCTDCYSFCHDIDAPLYRLKCYKCYFGPAV
jgi:hypothetical protein